MKNKICVLIVGLTIPFASCTYKDKRDIKKIQLITSDISTSSFFMAIDIECNGETYPIVIGNCSLYNMMLQSRMIKSREEYIDRITDIVLKKKTIQFKSDDKEILKSYSVVMCDSLSDFLKVDKSVFINRYFINGRLKNVPFPQEYSIIYYLFNIGIYCKRDCLTGSISIVKPNLDQPEPKR